MNLVLFDSDVVLDLLLEREGHVFHSASLFELAAVGLFNGAVSGVSLTDIWYIVQRQQDRHAALDAIDRLARQLVLLTVGQRVVEIALEDVHAGTFRDFEDAVQHAAAEAAGADVIVTRNKADFRGARIEVLTPIELITRL